jgi:acetyl/propionyl-CoA carboxylase alpha subunit
MRVVRSQADLDEALDAAEREAAGAFGDGALYCERYLERPRHVEVQLLADAQGGVVAVGERDCSVQRRHQKVLEEAPAPRLDTRMRERMLDAAVAFGRAIGYRGAGTVEFVLDGDEFFFLELNGRIQVEHPVTEAVTGLDLVERQIRIAEGEQLVARSDKAGGRGVEGHTVDGHAIEVRLYAEDPRSFLPQAGRIDRLTFPGNGPLRGEAGRVRVDAGVEEGDEVGIAYDSMIAKLVAHGQNREDALDTLAAALDETEVAGVTTNLTLLRWLVAHPVVRAAEATTAFLTEHPPLSLNPLVLSPAVWRRSWRLNLPAPPAAPPPDVDVESHRVGATHGESTIVAPMPGTVIRVEVEAGDSVQARSALVVLEAMKMEIPVHSPFDASVTAVHVAPGDRVAGGALLVELEN